MAWKKSLPVNELDRWPFIKLQESILKFLVNTQCSNLIIFHDILSRNHMHLLPDIFISLEQIFHYILGEWGKNVGNKILQKFSWKFFHFIILILMKKSNNSPFSIPISGSQRKIICFYHICVFYRVHHSLRCRVIGGKAECN